MKMFYKRKQKKLKIKNLRRCLGEVSSGSLPRACGARPTTPDILFATKTMVLLTCTPAFDQVL